MSISGDLDIEGLKRVSQFVSDTLHEMKRKVRVGMTTAELDDIAARLFKKAGARSAPIITYNFPAYTCISLNTDIAHGIPNNQVIQASDLINIDVSAELDGYFADTGHSFQIKPFTKPVQDLCSYTKHVLDNVISRLRAGTKLNEIGRYIKLEAQKGGYKTIENLCSHGVGRALHEYPETILNYYDRHLTGELEEGMVITIEPFLSTNDRFAVETDDGWTLTTKNNSLVAQHEHTLIITKEKPMVLTYLN